MATLFSTLGVGYSGLNVAQVGINTTGQNISNAETDGYSRKRVIQTAATPMHLAPGNIGNGVEIENIERVFDGYVYNRYTSTYSDKEKSDYMQKTLDELSTYFPEIDDVGIKADLKEYYSLWQRLADNPSDNSVKMDLAQKTVTLTDHVTQVNNQVYALQERLNDELKVNVDEVNRMASAIADINVEIDKAESGGGYTANDLRDKRSVLERDLSRVIGAKVNVEDVVSDITIDASATKTSGGYNLHVNGFNLVDGSSFHPIKVDNSNSPRGFYEIYYERQDGVLIPMEKNVQGGKIGAIMDLRGQNVNLQTGMPENGLVQDTYNELDSFAKTLIESTNNIYANAATTIMTSNSLEFNTNDPLVNSGLNIKEGSFNLIVYDADGQEVSSREITIDPLTSLTRDTNSIKSQIEENNDDNLDGNALNDIDDMMKFNAPDANTDKVLQLSLKKEYKDMGYTFAIHDNLKTEEFNSGTNFAGALGLRRFYDGDDASTIALASDLHSDPTKISAGGSYVTGDNSIALDMVQSQFERYDFEANSISYNDTVYGYFDIVSSNVGIKARNAATTNDTITAQFNAVEQEYESVSKVSIDEEMTNLIRYQTAYGASAKVITTIDQMLNTLLGLKQ